MEKSKFVWYGSEITDFRNYKKTFIIYFILYYEKVKAERRKGGWWNGGRCVLPI